MTSTLVAVLCSPGVGARFLHGRAWLPGASSPLSVYVTQQTSQHDCMLPADGSIVVHDVGLLDHSNARELRVDGVVMTGGSLVRLASPAEAQDIAPVALTFEPACCHVDAPAERLARRLFPELLDAMAACGQPLDGLLVVEGSLTLRPARGAPLAWAPLSTPAARAPPLAAATLDPSPRGSVAELLARRWEGSNVPFPVHSSLSEGIDDVSSSSSGGGGGGGGCGGDAQHPHQRQELHGALPAASSSSQARQPACAAAGSGEAEAGGGGWLSSPSFVRRAAAVRAAAAPESAAAAAGGGCAHDEATSAR